MDIIRKDATIANTDETFPGSFEVVLSAPTKDRDGDTLLPEDWKQPLPEHITFDADHGMSVASTVGSGVPRIDEATGNLIVSGSYSSLPRAQEVRTLVNEGHIRTTSVAFMSEKSEKDGATASVRELLNGAFVAIPSNREALVLASKTIKAGARNSKSDAEHIQAIHDSAIALGATPAAEKAATTAAIETKAVAGSLEATQERISDALNDAYAGEDTYVWLRATLPTYCVFGVNAANSSDSETYQQDYTDDGSVVTLTGDRTPVDLTEVVKPDPDEDAASDPGTDTTAPAKAAPVPSTTDLDELQNRARALSIGASTYTES